MRLDISRADNDQFILPFSFFKGGAKVAPHNNIGTAGQIDRISGSNILVGTGAGILAISEVKPEGKKIMSASAFMHGRHLKEGASFDTL